MSSTENIHNTEFNKNVAMVYTQEANFTGYKGLDWNKLDSIEDILNSGINVSINNFSSQSAYVDAFGRQRISNPLMLCYGFFCSQMDLFMLNFRIEKSFL
jgi:hypothetical protein